MATESELIAAVKAIFEPSGRLDDRILVPIGDDAAVIAQPKGKVVLTTDMAVEGFNSFFGARNLYRGLRARKRSHFAKWRTSR